MIARRLRHVVALAALFVAGSAGAQSDKPMVLITVKSAKDLITKLKDLTKSTMEAAGQGAMWPLIQGGIEAKLGKEGEKIPGFDPTKPLGVRIMYKKPSPPAPIDGDVLILLPATDATKFIGQGLPALGFANPAAGDGGLTTFALGPNAKAFAREASGYVAVSIAEAEVVSAAKLPKPEEVFGAPKHDLSLVVSPSAVPEEVARNVAKMLAGPTGGEKEIQQILDLDSFELNYDLDPSAGKVVFETVQSAKSGTGLATMLKGSTAGPLRSAIGLAPNAVFNLAMRGDWVAASGMFAQALQGLELAEKSVPGFGSSETTKGVMDLLRELSKTELEDFAVSISGDGTMVMGFALKSTASFELKVGELVEKLVPVIQKEAGENADKVKEMSKRDAETLSGVKVTRLWVPLNKKANAVAVSILFGVKDEVAFIATSFLETHETIENALKQKTIDSHEPLIMTLKLNELANAFRVLDYKGTSAIKAESKGGNPFKISMEIPVKDIAELIKAGLPDKIKERLGVGGKDDG